MIHEQRDRPIHFALEDSESYCPDCRANGSNRCDKPAADPIARRAGYRDFLPANTVHYARLKSLGL